MGVQGGAAEGCGSGGGARSQVKEGGEQYEVHVGRWRPARDGGGVGQMTVPSTTLGSVPLENIRDLTSGTSRAKWIGDRQRQVTVYAGFSRSVADRRRDGCDAKGGGGA